MRVGHAPESQQERQECRGPQRESPGAWSKEPGQVSRGRAGKDFVHQAEEPTFIQKAVDSVTSCYLRYRDLSRSLRGLPYWQLGSRRADTGGGEAGAIWRVAKSRVRGNGQHCGALAVQGRRDRSRLIPRLGWTVRHSPVWGRTWREGGRKPRLKGIICSSQERLELDTEIGGWVRGEAASESGEHTEWGKGHRRRVD